MNRAHSGATPQHTEIYGTGRATAEELITVLLVASPEPKAVKIDSDSIDPTIAHGCGRQDPIIPPSLNDMNQSPNPINILATMLVLPTRAEQRKEGQPPTTDALGIIINFDSTDDK